VVVVSPDERLGGMTSSGLGSADIGNKEVIGGLTREFYHRVWRYYQSPDVWKWQKKEDFGNRGHGALAVDGRDADDVDL
ncbi:MAG: FAD-dependent oxidoreductase, partial [Opitutae bacterium]|nr:FAD-dependent oxidoreductase [Opitutae bacterium]